MRLLDSSQGVSIIAAVFIIVILAFMGVMFLTMVNTASFTSVNDLQSAQALYVAEGGGEYILKNRSFPNYSTGGTTVDLGAGNFKVDTPAYLTADPGTVFPIRVNSTTSFPATGRIVIDSELIDYTAKNATQFTAGTRGAGGTTAVGHSTANAAVYPVATLTADPGVGGTTITVSANSTTGFLIPGIIKIDEEYIYCVGPVTATTFPNCTRNYKGSAADSHPVGSGKNVFQYMITSTGTVANAKRQVEKAVAGTGLSTHQGSFTKDNSGVANALQPITGVGFTPKAVIFFWTRQTAMNFSANVNAGVGFTTGTANERGVSVTAVDNSGASDDGRRRSDTHMIIFLTGGGGGGQPTVTEEAELVSFDTDGFTIRWTTNNINAYRIHYIALGGDITDAEAGSFSFTTGGAGNPLSINLAQNFKPDFVMFLWSYREAVDTANIADSEIGIGLARSAAAQGAMSYGARDNTGNNSAKNWYQRTDSAILVLNPGSNPPNEYARASFVSMDNTGFTIRKDNPPGAATPIFYLALKGGQHRVGSFLQPTATIGSAGFQPEQVMLVSRGLITSNSVDFLGGVSIGAAHRSGTQGSIWFQDIGGAAAPDPSEANMYTQTTDIMTFATGPNTVNARATFGAFNSDGFTLNWPTNDGTARQILYWAIGPNVARSGTNITPVNLDWREVYP